MTNVALPSDLRMRRLKRALRSPKGNLIVVLGAITVLAVAGAGSDSVLPQVIDAVCAAVLVDIAIQRIERGVWVVPTAGILTGLIVGLVLSPYESGAIAPAAAVLAVTSKHLFRTRIGNVFNPAAFGLVVAAVMFDAGHNWWGALPDLGWSGAVIVAAAGWYTAARIKRLPVVLVFVGVFYTLATVVSFVASPSELAGLFRSPDVHAALFFAFFMLDDPPTSPTKVSDQVLFGIIVATTSFVFFYEFGWLYYTLAGLLVGNAWWAATRTLRARRRVSLHEPTPQASF